MSGGGLDREALEIVHAAMSQTLLGRGMAVPEDWLALPVAKVLALTEDAGAMERFVAALLGELMTRGVDPASLAGELWTVVAGLPEADGRGAVGIVRYVLERVRDPGWGPGMAPWQSSLLQSQQTIFPSIRRWPEQERADEEKAQAWDKAFAEAEAARAAAESEAREKVESEASPMVDAASAAGEIEAAPAVAAEDVADFGEAFGAGEEPGDGTEMHTPESPRPPAQAALPDLPAFGVPVAPRRPLMPAPAAPMVAPSTPPPAPRPPAAAQAAPKSSGGLFTRLFGSKGSRGFRFVEMSADDKFAGIEIHAEPKPGGGAEKGAATANATAVRVFYATDRMQIPTLNGDVRYDKHRSLRGKLHLGECEVSIPKKHKTGRVESPSLLRFEFRPDPKKHIVLTKTRTLEEARFLAEVRGAVIRSPGKEAFVFIHGYNVSFEDAARRTGQMAFDLDFVGAPIFYSWPSNGKVADYMKDETNVAWSAPHLEQFLTMLAAESGALRIHLIAHSMGNRAACEALKSLSKDPQSKLRFSHLILAAPDIDAETFAELAVMLKRVSGKITLYESSRDKAIRASKKIHGNARAGEPLLVIEGMDTIDASAIDTDFLAHSYFSDSWPLLADIHSILSQDMEPGSRFGLRRVEAEAGSYFAFRE